MGMKINNQEEYWVITLCSRGPDIPNTARAIEMKATYLTLISSHQFTGLDHEDPYTHLSTLYELTATMGFEERDKEAVYLRLFPFSLAGKAKKTS